MAILNRSGSGYLANTSKTVVRRVLEYVGFFGAYGVGESPVLTHDKALEISAVNCAVRMIAEAVSAASFEVYETKYKGNRKIRKIRADHPLNDLLENPNTFQTQSEFLETVVYNAVFGSGALILKVMDGTGKVNQLIPVPLGSFTQEVLEDHTSQFVVQFADGSTRIYPREQCIFFHGVGHDGYAAFPALVAARNALGVSKSLEKAQRAYAESSGAPRGVVSLLDDMESPELAEKVAASWEQRFKAGQGGIAVVAGDTKFTNLSENFNDSKFLEQRQLMVQEVARFFKIPTAYLMGEGKLDKYTEDMFISKSVMPWLRRIEQALTKDLVTEKNIKIVADETDLIRADLTAQADFIMKMTGLGGGQSIITVNEGRSLLGYEEKDDPKYDILSDGGYAQVANIEQNTAKKPKETDEEDREEDEDDEKEDK